MNDSRRTKVTTGVFGETQLTRLDTSACRVVVTNSVSRGKILTLRGSDSAILGAGEESALKVEDPTVSRAHARITKMESGALVEDLGSTNGTFYERSQVKEAVVPFGATILLGKASIKILPQENEVMAAPSTVAKFGALVGEDRRMRQMFSLLADVAPTDATVVIEGETGTGKELVASALHDHSPRASKPFVVFDCSAVPHDLVESALFGHMKGAFTGATQSRQGAFRRAHGGTIFLDEIGELPLDLQPKLLRALESRTVQMVGGDNYDRVDVRVICATNRNLKEEVRGGRFREDLFYRLAVVRIVLPALRERSDDIKILVEHFLQSADSHLAVNQDSYAALRAYNWPGNVRELKNLVERARSLWRGSDPVDLAQYLPGGMSEFSGLRQDDEDDPNATLGDESGGAFPEVFKAAREALDRESGLSFKDAKTLLVEAFEKRYLKDLLEESEGNISRAAQNAQMDRKHLRELLKKNGLWDG